MFQEKRTAPEPIVLTPRMPMDLAAGEQLAFAPFRAAC
jgi:hypothetical protein